MEIGGKAFSKKIFKSEQGQYYQLQRQSNCIIKKSLI